MWSKKKRRGERQLANQGGPADPNQQRDHEYILCKRFLEVHPNMTISELAEHSSTELEQWNTDDLKRITVKDIFHLLESKNDPAHFNELAKVILSVAQKLDGR